MNYGKHEQPSRHPISALQSHLGRDVRPMLLILLLGNVLSCHSYVKHEVSAQRWDAPGIATLQFLFDVQGLQQPRLFIIHGIFII